MPDCIFEDLEMLFRLKIDDFLDKEDECECCGSVQPLWLMMRPGAPRFSDSDLVEMVDDLGEATAIEHYERSKQYVTSYECCSCRALDDERYFVILAVREDR